MTEKTDDANCYQCIDPELGAQLWQYDAPDLDPEQRRRLDNHLDICHACRMARALQQRVAQGLQTGRLFLDAPDGTAENPLLSWFSKWRSGWRPNAVHRLGYAGAFALALAVALIFSLPPHPPFGDLRARGAGQVPCFLRPVPGEVILTQHPVFTWTANERASSYRLRLREVGGTYEWSGETSEPRIQIPRSAPLPRGVRFRGFLEPTPAYLAPPGGIPISFRTGSFGGYFAYRLTSAPHWVLLIGILGLVLAALAPSVSIIKSRLAENQPS